MHKDTIHLVSIKPSEKPEKKYDALFHVLTKEDKGYKEKRVSFGAKGMSDFTIHKDEERKKRYIARHQANEDWTNPLTAGALSRWVLWNKPSLRASISDFKKRFNLD